MAELELPALVDPAWLEAHLEHPGLRVIDASWYLPDAGRDARAEYAAAHVPGAIYLDLSTDLADVAAPLRNTVASPAALGARFAAAGIGSEHAIVLYDRLGGYSAGRIWWTLRYVGHANSSLLDGGFTRWQAEGRPVSARVPDLPPARFDVRERPRWLVARRDVEAALRDGSAQIVDARSAARFRGEGVEHAARRGHMPGSLNVPYDRNLAGDPPRLRSPEELRALYVDAGVDFERPVITSCGSGVTASLSAFALTQAGHPDVAVYDGSWSEWGNAADTPVETGPGTR